MFAVVFQVSPRAGRWDDYLHRAAILRPELLKIDGFIDNERFISRTEPGWLVSLSIWRDAAAVITWREHPQHRAFQAEGRAHLLTAYRLRVAEIIDDSAAPSRHHPPHHRQPARTSSTSSSRDAAFLHLIEAPVDSATPYESITRPGHGLTLNAWPAPNVTPDGVPNVIPDVARHVAPEVAPKVATHLPPAPPPGEPGMNHTNAAFAAAQQTDASQAAFPLTPSALVGRHRLTRVIRDYGLHDRAQAPTDFLPVA